MWSIKVKWVFSKLKERGSSICVGRGLSLTGPEYIRIGNCFSAGSNLSLAAYECYRGKKTGMVPELIIGDNVSVMDNCAISCMNQVVIGDNVLMGANVFITDNYHGHTTMEEMEIPPRSRELYSKGPVTIGRNVWIGRNVCIMPNVSIGDGAIIGANAVVTHDVPAKCVAAGVPAKVLKGDTA